MLLNYMSDFPGQDHMVKPGLRKGGYSGSVRLYVYGEGVRRGDGALLFWGEVSGCGG